MLAASSAHRKPEIWETSDFDDGVKSLPTGGATLAGVEVGGMNEDVDPPLSPTQSPVVHHATPQQLAYAEVSQWLLDLRSSSNHGSRLTASALEIPEYIRDVFGWFNRHVKREPLNPTAFLDLLDAINAAEWAVKDELSRSFVKGKCEVGHLHSGCPRRVILTPIFQRMARRIVEVASEDEMVRADERAREEPRADIRDFALQTHREIREKLPKALMALMLACKPDSRT